MFSIVCGSFIKRGTCFELLKTPLYSKGGVLYCLRHLQIAREVFLIVYGSFIKRATCFEFLRHLYIAREVFCIVFVTFLK